MNNQTNFASPEPESLTHWATVTCTIVHYNLLLLIVHMYLYFTQLASKTTTDIRAKNHDLV